MARKQSTYPPRFAYRILPVSFLLLLLSPSAGHSQSASSLDKRGQAAETREDYDAAYDAFRQAHLKRPNDLRYKTRYERAKFQAGAAHIDRGRVLRQSGDLPGALNEFIRAHQIDPSNQTAEQEIRQVQGQLPAIGPDGGSAASVPQGTQGPEKQTSAADSALATLGSVAGPVALQPVSTDPITLHMVEDVKVIYQAIGKAAGLNVLFDPDYTSRRIPVA